MKLQMPRMGLRVVPVVLAAILVGVVTSFAFAQTDSEPADDPGGEEKSDPVAAPVNDCDLLPRDLADGLVRIADRATGKVIEMTNREYCEQAVAEKLGSDEELQRAGLVGVATVENGRVIVHYYEERFVDGEYTSGAAPISDEEAAQRVAAVR